MTTLQYKIQNGRCLQEIDSLEISKSIQLMFKCDTIVMMDLSECIDRYESAIYIM